MTVINDVILSVATKIISAFIVFFIGYYYALKPKVKISKNMIKGFTEYNGSQIMVYKFKIVNTSHFFKAGNFAIKLFAVKKKYLQEEGIYIEYYTPVKIICKGLSVLAQYRSKRKIKKLRKRYLGNKYFSCWHNVFTNEDLFGKYKGYDLFRLSVTYKNYFNQEITVEQYYPNNEDNIFIGELSHDGDLDGRIHFSSENTKKYNELSNNNI